MATKALHNPVPCPHYLSDLIIYFSPLFSFNSTLASVLQEHRPLAAIPIQHGVFHPKTFALAVPSTWNAFPPDIHGSNSSTPSNVWFKIHPLNEAYPWPSI